MLLPRRAICALSKGKSIQYRLISQSARRQLEPVVGKGEEADPQLGGYPQLTGASTQERTPFGWWDTQYRRNYGETLHEQDEAVNMFSPDIPHTNIEPSSALLQATLAFGGFAAAMTLLAYTRPEMPATRRVYPNDGLVEELGGWQQNKARTESLEEP